MAFCMAKLSRFRLPCTHTRSSFSMHNWKTEGNWGSPRADVIHSNTYTFILTGSSSASLVTVVVGRWCLSVLKQFAKGFTLPFTAHLASAHLQWKRNMKHAVRHDTCIPTLCTHGPNALKYAHTYTNKHKVTPAMWIKFTMERHVNIWTISSSGSKANSLRQAEFQILLWEN